MLDELQEAVDEQNQMKIVDICYALNLSFQFILKTGIKTLRKHGTGCSMIPVFVDDPNNGPKYRFHKRL